MAKNQFVHLHCHTGASVLDGHTTIKEMVSEAAALGQPAIAATDHGAMYFSHELWKEAKAAGIKGIVGVEAYMTPGDAPRDEKKPIFFGTGTKEERAEGAQDVSARGAYTHMTMLAENNEGMHNLFKLSTLASRDGYFKKPRMDINILSQHSKGIIATTGCPSGELQTRLRLGQWNEAVKYVDKMQNIFGRDNYFLELMDHDMKATNIERIVKEDLLRIGKHMNIPLLATNDLHYARRDQALSHEQLLALQSGSTMADLTYDQGGKRFAFSGEEFYIKSADEMEQIFGHMPEALTNTLAIAERCNVTFEERDDLRPNVLIPDGMTETEFIRSEVMEGFYRRLPQFAHDKRYLDRIDMELSVLDLKGYNGYFLVTSDFVRWAKNNGVEVGYGRGSAGGSLVSFCLDITDLDPIRYDLLFERFINPERDSPPDIDMDFDDIGRARVIKYVTDKYGSDQVAQIITYGKIGAKQALKDSLRVMNGPYALGDVLSKSIPPPQAGKELKLSQLFDPNHPRYHEGEKFRDEVDRMEDKNIIVAARGLEGRMRSTGVHAAGVIISSKKLSDHIPLFTRPEDGATITQFDYPTCESLGLIKFDFLGIKNLTIIAKAIDHIRRRHGIEINAVELVNGPMDDAKTYELFQRGDTLGIFQLDSGGIRSLLKLMKPTSIEDILAVLALYRPGPMGMNSHIAYAERKNGREAVIAPHPELKGLFDEVMGDTFGLCVAGDTLVYDADSGQLVRIDQIEDKVRTGNFKTFSVAADGKIESKKVTNWFHSGKKKIYEITATDGRIIRVSPEHPVLTPSGYKKAEDLIPGVDRVATAGEAFEPNDVSGVSENEANLMGYLIGDGYINLYQNSFTNSSPEILNHVESVAKNTFSDMHIRSYPRTRDGKYYTTHMYFSAVAQGSGRGKGKKGDRYKNFEMNKWLSSTMGYDAPTSSEKKFVPEAIFRSSNQAIVKFLAGMWDTDGHVSSTHFYLRTISKELAYGTQKLLDRLGIHASVVNAGTYMSKKGERTSYGVYVYDIEFWKQVVPHLVHPEKNSVVKEIGKNQPIDRGLNSQLMKSTMRNHVLNSDTLPKHIISRLSKMEEVSHKSIFTFMKSQGLTGMLSKPSQFANGDNGFVIMNGNSLAYLENYASDEDMFYARQSWTMIKTIEIQEEEDVYDITVEDNHNFFADGVLVHNCTYQEQLMKAAQIAANYTLAQADNLRRAMGKKKKEVLEKEYKPFSEGMIANGYSQEAIDTLWNIFVPFAEYGFNKSHSAGYALLSYVTAYLKANFPAEYMSALLTVAMDDKKKTAVYLDECRRMGIKVSSPNVSQSMSEYAPVEDDEIRVGLNGVRGVGHDVAEGIVTEAQKEPYKDITDYLMRAPSQALGKGVIESLIDAGAFDDFGYTRRSLATSLPELAKSFAGRKKKEEKGQFDLFSMVEEVEAPIIDIENLPEYSKKDKLAREGHAIGLYVSDHPLSNMADTLDSYVTNHIVDIDSGVLTASPGFGDKKSKVTFAGVVGNLVRKPTRKGDMFASFMLEDMTGSVPAVMFPKSYAEHGTKLESDGIFIVRGSLLGDDEGEVKIAVDSVEQIQTTHSGEIPFIIRLQIEQTTAESLDLLGEALQRHPGEQKVHLYVTERGVEKLYELDDDFKIKVDQTLRNEISYLFGVNWM